MKPASTLLSTHSSTFTASRAHLFKQLQLKLAAARPQTVITSGVGRVPVTGQKKASVSRKTVFGSSARKRPLPLARRRNMQSAQPMDLSHIRNTIRGLSDTMHSNPHPHAAAPQAAPHPTSSTHRVKKRRSTVHRSRLSPLTNVAEVSSKIIQNPRRWWEGVVSRHHKRRQREQLRRQLRELSVKFSLGGRRKTSPSGGRIDTTLAWGDILMMTATQIASERIPLTQAGFLSGVLVATWVGVASMKGDYQHRRSEPVMPFFGDHYKHMFRALLTSASTWIIFVPTTVVVCMSLLSRHYLDWAPFAAKHAAEDMPAEAEVLLASLWTLGAWRGTYAMLRPFL